MRVTQLLAGHAPAARHAATMVCSMSGSSLVMSSTCSEEASRARSPLSNSRVAFLSETCEFTKLSH